LYQTLWRYTEEKSQYCLDRRSKARWVTYIAEIAGIVAVFLAVQGNPPAEDGGSKSEESCTGGKAHDECVSREECVGVLWLFCELLVCCDGNSWGVPATYTWIASTYVFKSRRSFERCSAKGKILVAGASQGSETTLWGHCGPSTLAVGWIPFLHLSQPRLRPTRTNVAWDYVARHGIESLVDLLTLSNSSMLYCGNPAIPTSLAGVGPVGPITRNCQDLIEQQHLRKVY
jgi:hypothetical protein